MYNILLFFALYDLHAWSPGKIVKCITCRIKNVICIFWVRSSNILYNYFSEVFQEDLWSGLGDSWLRDNITIGLRISMRQLSSKLIGITRRDPNLWQNGFGRRWVCAPNFPDPVLDPDPKYCLNKIIYYPVTMHVGVCDIN